MNEKLAWDVARAGGIVAWALLCLAMVWGLLLASRLLVKRPAPAWLLDMHRFFAGLAVCFTAVHVAGLVADNYLTFGAREVLVPFASTWHRGSVAMGVLAMYLLVAIELTSLLKRWLPNRLWRGVHRSSFPLFWLASMHGALAGTDATSVVYRATSVVAVAAVVLLVGVRLVIGRRSVRRGRSASTATSAVPVESRTTPAVPEATLVDAGAPRSGSS